MNQFRTPEEAHEHSLLTLNTLYDHDEFMDSIESVADLGCGAGLDILWWSNLMTKDEVPEPHNYKCFAIDKDLRHITNKGQFPTNVVTLKGDYEKALMPITVDLLWAHNSFQYTTNPLKTLKRWNSFMNEDGMLIIEVPLSTKIEYNRFTHAVADRQFYDFNISNMMYMLAVNGFDCNDGYFLKRLDSNWLSIAVYKSDIEPMDPFKTPLYDVAESGLLPESAVDCIMKYGYLHQWELQTRWIDGLITNWANI